MKCVIVLLAVVAVAMAASTCVDVTKTSPKCDNGPKKACKAEGGNEPDFSNYNDGMYNALKAQWDNTDKAVCDAYKKLETDQKKALVALDCATLGCDAEGWADKCWDNYASMYEDDLCTPAYEEMCRITKKTTTFGGELCEDATDCDLKICYDFICRSWCYTTAKCDAMVTAGVVAPKDAKKCMSAAEAVVPAFAMLLLALLALF